MGSPAVTTHDGDLTGAGAAYDGALAALGAGCLQKTLFLQRLEVVTDGGGGAKTHGGADLPDGGGVAVLLDKLVYIIYD